MYLNKVLALLIVFVSLGLIQQTIVSFFGIIFPNTMSHLLLGVVFVFAGMAINQIIHPK